MDKVLNFTYKEKMARRMTTAQVIYAMRDCRACIAAGVDPDYYRDEISVYNQELQRRGVLPEAGQ